MAHQRVGNQIQKLRKKAGLTQAELARKVGVARVSIVSIESGRFLPTIETALRISHALNCSLEHIFWLKDDTQ